GQGGGGARRRRLRPRDRRRAPTRCPCPHGGVMTERHIVAMGGGQWPSDPIYPFLFDLADAAKPKVLYVPTPTGDNDRGVSMFYRSFPAHSFEPSDLGLFERTVEDLRSFVLAQDVVLVAGGNTMNMLAIWRAHGLDTVLRD